MKNNSKSSLSNICGRLVFGNSWYFRNALVRANYRNPSKGVEPNKSFLVKFFRNLMLGEQHELKNRYMLIGYNDTDNTHTSTHTSTSTSTNNLKASLTENIKRCCLCASEWSMPYDANIVHAVKKVLQNKNRFQRFPGSIFWLFRWSDAILSFISCPFLCRKYLVQQKVRRCFV